MKTISEVRDAFLNLIKDSSDQYKASIRVTEYPNSIEFVCADESTIHYLWIKLAMFAGGEFDSNTGKVMGGTDYYLWMQLDRSYDRQIRWLEAQAAREI